MANLKEVIEESFIQYSGAVLQSRALVDVRDCLKPSARQILYCMYTDKFTQDKPFKKTLKAIGSASRVYIHGDASAEGIIMRNAQPFAMNHPLVEVEGSFGNLIESGNWAAPRYTGSRLTSLCNYLFDGIKKDTITEWRDNYDDTEKYPAVLPSIGFYNIVNGTMGIGVGASSSIPPTNLKEVNMAIIKLIRNPEAPFDEIVCYPDFPTGAILTNRDEVKESLRLGQGKSCRLRSVIKYVPAENCLEVTEIPYMLYTNTICGELETIITENEDTTFIDRFNDLTGSTPKIKIYLKKGTNPNKAIEYLYKNTSLESHYSINMTMLRDGRFPEVFNWKTALLEYIKHIRECKQREIQFDLNKALARENVINGLLIAAANIDEVIAIIRASQDSKEASEKLIACFGFNEEQVKAILAIKLASLTKIDSIKLNNELAQIKVDISKYKYLLSNPLALDKVLIEILQDIANKFGQPRRTKIENILGDEEEPEEIKEEDVIVCRNGNTIQVVKKEAYRGKKADNPIYTTNFGSLVLFTDVGKFYKVPLSKVKYDKKLNISDVFDCGSEKPMALIDSFSFNSYHTVTLVTNHGYIKKSRTSEYNVQAKKGTAAIKLEENDSIIGVIFSADDDDKVFVLSDKDYYNCYSLSEISPTGRTTKGVKAIKLDADGFVKEAKWVGESEYKNTGRAVKGVKL